jgi:hypothetical protein
MSKPILAVVATSVLYILFLVPAIQAQVLITGENGGKGSQSAMISANAIQAKGFGTLSNFWVQYGRGVADRVDAFFGYGSVTVFGRSQSYVAIGSNIGLLGRTVAGVDVSLYNNASIAINHRQEASRVLLATAVIASRPINVGDRSVMTAYGGVSRLTPIIRPVDSIFTPPSPVYSGIAGLSVPISSAVTFYGEINPGGLQRSAGIGMLYVFPDKRGASK